MDHCYVCCTLSHFITQLQWYFICCFRYGEHGWTRPRFPQMVIEISPSRCQRISYREYRLLREQHVDIPTRPSLREELSKPNLLNVFDFKHCFRVLFIKDWWCWPSGVHLNSTVMWLEFGWYMSLKYLCLRCCVLIPLVYTWIWRCG